MFVALSAQELRLASDAELRDGQLEVDDPWWDGIEVPDDVEAGFNPETLTLSPSSSRRPDPNASRDEEDSDRSDHSDADDGVEESKRFEDSDSKGDDVL